MLLKFLPYLPCFSYGACVHAKSLQSCPTLCDPVGCSSLGCPWDSPVKNTEGIAMYSSRSSRPRDRTQVSCIIGRFFTIWATREAHTRCWWWFRCQVMSASFATSWTVAHQASLTMGFPRQGYWSGLPFPSPGDSFQPRHIHTAAAAAAKLLQLCLTLCDPIDSSPPGSPVPGILQARTLEWVAISFSNAWKWKVKGKLLSRVWLLATPWTAAYQAPPSMGFSRQEYWSGVPLPSP